MNDKLEKNIYILLTQLVRDEIDYKRRIGAEVFELLFDRINNEDKFPIEEDVELNMLTFIGILVRNCKENVIIVANELGTLE